MNVATAPAPALFSQRPGLANAAAQDKAGTALRLGKGAILLCPHGFMLIWGQNPQPGTLHRCAAARKVSRAVLVT